MAKKKFKEPTCVEEALVVAGYEVDASRSSLFVKGQAEWVGQNWLELIYWCAFIIGSLLCVLKGPRIYLFGANNSNGVFFPLGLRSDQSGQWFYYLSILNTISTTSSIFAKGSWIGGFVKKWKIYILKWLSRTLLIIFLVELLFLNPLANPLPSWNQIKEYFTPAKSMVVDLQKDIEGRWNDLLYKNELLSTSPPPLQIIEPAKSSMTFDFFKFKGLSLHHILWVWPLYLTGGIWLVLSLACLAVTIAGDLTDTWLNSLRSPIKSKNIGSVTQSWLDNNMTKNRRLEISGFIKKDKISLIAPVNKESIPCGIGIATQLSDHRLTSIHGVWDKGCLMPPYVVRDTHSGVLHALPMINITINTSKDRVSIYRGKIILRHGTLIENNSTLFYSSKASKNNSKKNNHILEETHELMSYDHWTDALFQTLNEWNDKYEMYNVSRKEYVVMSSVNNSIFRDPKGTRAIRVAGLVGEECALTGHHDDSFVSACPIIINIEFKCDFIHLMRSSLINNASELGKKEVADLASVYKILTKTNNQISRIVGHGIACDLILRAKIAKPSNNPTIFFGLQECLSQSRHLRVSKDGIHQFIKSMEDNDASYSLLGIDQNIISMWKEYELSEAKRDLQRSVHSSGYHNGNWLLWVSSKKSGFNHKNISLLNSLTANESGTYKFFARIWSKFSSTSSQDAWDLDCHDLAAVMSYSKINDDNNDEDRPSSRFGDKIVGRMYVY